ncbi:MAG: biopolymer transporter ExbD [Pseudomonadota bacterium]
MREKRRNVPKEATVDLTPMLDVVFILLIFFIVTSTFIQEKAIGMEPPPPNCPGCSSLPSLAIIVYIDETDTIRVGSKLTDLASVRSDIERIRAESPESPVIIQADAFATTGTVIQIRDIVYDANVERVNIVRSAQKT